MHDFDRTQAEYESLIPGLETSQQEYEYEDELIPGEFEAEDEYEQPRGDSPFSEGEEMQLAAELMDVRNDQELEHFLGSLISKVGSGIKNFANSSVGKALGGVLKKAAKAALPIAGSALGTFIGGPAGGMLGGKLASAAGNMFGLELEGLSGEDKEFETARRFVRFAGHAAQHAARSPRGANPRRVARSAIIRAAQQHAPGLLQRSARAGPGHVPRWDLTAPHMAAAAHHLTARQSPSTPFQAITRRPMATGTGRTRRQTTRALTRPTGTATTPAIRA